MANPQPGDPKLVAQIVNRLKSQGLFDQFRRDCLADVDTKPAYQNLRQRVDSFVSSHLAGHTWSPHLNKNQLRNNIRQQVLNSGMLESGIDRIISQVVDPKINQMFRPQVEKAVHEFLNNVTIREEASTSIAQNEEKMDSSVTAQGLSTAGPCANVANNALSILETISSLNQEASAARASTENPCSKSSDRSSKKLLTQQNLDTIMEKEPNSEEVQEKRDVQEQLAPEPPAEGVEMVMRQEDLREAQCPNNGEMHPVKEASILSLPSADSVLEIEKNLKVSEKSEEQRTKVTDKSDEKKDNVIEKIEEKKANLTEKSDEPKAKVTEKSEEQRTKVAKVTDKSEELKAKETDASEVQKAKASDKSDEQKVKKPDKSDKKSDAVEKPEKKEEKRENKMDKKEEKRESKTEKKIDHFKKTDDGLKAKEEKPWKETISDRLYKYKATEVLKEEYSLDDSDLDALSDITVSSVHTSDLSSFEEESEEEAAVSDTTEEGEITSDDEDENLDAQFKTKPQTDEQAEVKPKTGRHPYVHKPYLYSRYYSDSDDELTVEQRRQSIARAKEDRLIRRQLNRERLEEKRKLKATEKAKSLKMKNPGKMGSEGSVSKGLDSKPTSMKEALKEQMFLEKKVAVSKRRKRESRFSENSWKRRYDYSEEDSRDSYKTSEAFEKPSSASKDLKHMHLKSERKSSRRASEPLHLTEENKEDTKREQKRRTSSLLEGTAQDSESREMKKRVDKMETNYEEQQKKKSASNVEKQKKDSSHADSHNSRSTPKKEVKSCREKGDRERSLSEDKSSSRHRYKADGVQKAGEDVDRRSSERVLKGEEKHSQPSKASDDKSDRKSKHKSERKPLAYSKDGRTVSEHTARTDESSRRESSRKERHLSTEKSRSEHKSRRSTSDSKTHRDSQGSSRQSNSASQKKIETYSEDKYDLESTNSDSNSKHEDCHKDRRRSKSSSEEKSSIKSKSKSASKPSKSNEVESQEANQKPDKETSLGGGDADKHRDDNILKESIIDKLQRIAYSGIISEKESGHKTKFLSGDKVNERYRSDYKELSLCKTEKKVAAECNTSRNSKHSGREIKRREDGDKSEDKPVKQMQESPEKMQGSTMALDKSNKKMTSENSRGCLEEDATNRETKLFSAASVDGNTSPHKKQSGENSPYSQQECEQTETDSQQNSQLILKTSYRDSQPEIGSKNTTEVCNASGDQPRNQTELKAAKVIFALAPQVASNDDDSKHFDNDNSVKDIDSDTINSIKPSEEQEVIKQGAHQMNIVSVTSDTISLASSLSVQNCAIAQKNGKTSTCSKKHVSSVISSSTGEDFVNHSKGVDSSHHTGKMVCESMEQNEEITSLKESTVMLGSNLAVTADLEVNMNRVSSLGMEGSKSTVVETSHETREEEPLKGMHEVEKSDAVLIGLCTNSHEETVKLPNANQSSNFGNTVVPVRAPKMGTVEDEHAMNDVGSWKNKPTDAYQDAMTKMIGLTEITDKDGLVSGKDTYNEVRATLSLRTAGGWDMSDVGTSANPETLATVNCSEGLNRGTMIGSVAEDSVNTVNEEETKNTELCNSAEGEKGIDRSKEAIGITVGDNTEESEHIRTEDMEGRGSVIGTSTENKVESTVMDISTESLTGAMRRSGKDEEATSSCSVMDSSTGRKKSAVPMVCMEKDSENAATSSGTVMDNCTKGRVFCTSMSTENYIENAATSSTTVVNRSTHITETCARSGKDSEAAASSSSTVCTSNSRIHKAESEVAVINSECDGDDTASSSGSVVGTSTWEGKVVKLSLGNEGDEAASSSGTVMDRNTEERAASSSGTMMGRGTEDRDASSSGAMMDINTEERAESSSGMMMERNAQDRAASSSGTLMDRNTEERAESSSRTMMNRNTEERTASSSGTNTDRNTEDRTASSSGRMMDRNTEESTASSSGSMTDRITEESTASSSGSMTDRNTEERTASSSGTMADRITEESTASSSGRMTDRNTEERTASSSGTMTGRITEESTASSSGSMTDRNTEERTASSSGSMTDRITEESTASSSGSMTDRNTEERTASSSGTMTDRITEESTASSSGSMMERHTEERTASSSETTIDRSTEKRPVSSSGTEMNRHTEDRAASSSGTMMEGSTGERTATSSGAMRDRSVKERADCVMVRTQKDGEAATSSSSIMGDDVGSESQMATEMHRVIVYVEGNESSISNTEEDNDHCSFAASGEGSSVSSATCATESDITLPVAKLTSSGNDDTSPINNGGQATADMVHTETIVKSEQTEEKEDTVSSASSEEKHTSFTLGSRHEFESTVTDIGETEGDRTVTSAGTMVGVASMACENSGESESSVSCANLEKDDAAADGVTCANVEYPVGEVAICEDVKEEYEVVTGANLQETVAEGAFIAAYIERDGDDTTTSTVMDQEGQTPAVNPRAEEGESAVTSTGITEEQSERVAVCAEMGNGGEFLIYSGLEEKEEDGILNRIDTKEGDFSEDDESAITSTGTKEDEEGEGIVTSTGTGNYDSSSCTGTEGNVESVVIPTVTEGEGSVFCTGIHLKKDGVVTVTSAGIEQPAQTVSVSAEMEDPISCANANDTIEGVVTSANTEADIVNSFSITASENRHEIIPRGTENLHESLSNTTAMEDNESKIAILNKLGNGERSSTATVTEIVESLSQPLETCREPVHSANTIEAKGDCPENKLGMQMVLGPVVEAAVTAVITEEKGEDPQSRGHKKEAGCVATGQNTAAHVSLTEAVTDPTTVEEDMFENAPRKEMSSEGDSQNTCLHTKETSVQISEFGILSTDNTGQAANLTSELKREKDSDSPISFDQAGHDLTNIAITGSKQVLEIETCEQKHMSRSGERVNTVDMQNTSEADIKVDAKVIHLKVEVEKRKRGRPRKYPSTTQETKKPANDTGIHEEKSSTDDDGTEKSKEPECKRGRKTKNASSSIDEPGTLGEDSEKPVEKSSTDDDASDKSKECVPRRGRKPKRSCSSTEETEILEPEIKRQRSESAAKEDENEEEDEEEEDEEEDEDDEDEKNRGATTRAASKLEAQRKQPPKPTTRATTKLSIPALVSPRERRTTKEKLPSDAKSGKSAPLRSKPQPTTSTKRKREASPQAVRTRGQQAPDETQIKRAKRQ